MTQRSWIDAMRCLIYTNAAAIDRAKTSLARPRARRPGSWPTS